jgi:hypothetical protein
VLGISKVKRNKIWLLDYKVQASTDQASNNTPPDNPILYIIADTHAGSIAADNPQSHNDGNDVHQSIPGQVERTNV